MDEIVMEHPYGVYVREDPAGRIYDINSDAFIFNTQGWVKIDEGYGDRYHHAQGNYLPKPKMDERGIFRYKSYPSADAPSGEVIARYFKDGVEYLILERTQEEMDGDYVPPAPTVSDTDEALAELAYLAAENAARLDEQDAALVELAALLTEGGV